MSELVDRLRSANERIADGVLTLDRDKARERLRTYQLPSPHHYVLQFVRAARILGAPRVEFQIDARDATCRFQASFDPRLLEDLWGNAFAPRHDAATRALHCLALGVGSALALPLESIRVDTADVTLVITDEGETLVRRTSPGKGTVIHVRDRARLGLVFEFLSHRFGETAEARALREYCARAPFDVVVNGELMGAMQRPFKGRRARFDSRNAAGIVELDRVLPESILYLARDGIYLGHIAAPIHGIPMRAMVESPTLQTDLSGLKYVMSDAPDRLLHAAVIPVYHAAFLDEFESKPLDELMALDLAVKIVEYAGAVMDVGTQLHDSTRALLDTLLGSPLFETATPDRRRASIAEGAGVVRYARARVDDAFDDSRPVLFAPIRSDDPAARLRQRLLAALAGTQLAEVEDVTSLLLDRQIGARNRAIRAQQPPWTPTVWPFERRIELDGIRAGVYLPVAAPGGMLMGAFAGGFLCKDSRLLRRLSSDLPIGVWIDGAVEADARWADIVRDERVTGVAVVLAAAVLDLARAYADGLLTLARPEPVPRLTDAIVRSFVTGRLPGQVFDLLGYDSNEYPESLWAHPELRALRMDSGNLAELGALGPLLQLPSYRTSSDQPQSLAELLPELSSLELPGADEGGAHLAVDPTQHEILTHLQTWARQWSAAHPQPVSTRPRRQRAAQAARGDERLDALRDLLIRARGERRELFDDHLAYSFGWGVPADGGLCRVTGEGVRVNPEHPLVARLTGGDPAGAHFVASVVYSRINAWYRSITDHDELELQARLLGLRNE